MAHAGFAAVDAGNVGIGPPHGMLGRLRCPAARDEDGLLFPIRPVGPKQMIVRAPSFAVLPEPLILFQVIDWWRIRITIVEVADFLRDAERRRMLFCSLTHRK